MSAESLKVLARESGSVWVSELESASASAWELVSVSELAWALGWKLVSS
jgi:hypothetical protein